MAKVLKNTSDEQNNPCLQEQNMSMDCLDKNGYVKEKCTLFFDNYNTCKKFWGKVYSDRRRRGIQPYLPVVEEREQIKSKYLGNKTQ